MRSHAKTVTAVRMGQAGLILKICWLVTVAVLGFAASMAYAEEGPNGSRFSYTVERDVVYSQVADAELKADIYQPNGEGPFTSVLLIHGGGWFAGSKDHMRIVARNCARQGLRAISINYRLAPRHPFPAQIIDCWQALRWVAEHVDEGHTGDSPRPVAIYGYSAGGQLAALLAALAEMPNEERQKIVVRELANAEGIPPLLAVVAGGAPIDFTALRENNPILSYWLGGTRAQRPEMYRLASPLQFVHDDYPDTFLYHGERDLLVPRTNSQRLAASLKAAGVAVELLTVADAGHVHAFYDRAAMNAAIAFLKARLP